MRSLAELAGRDLRWKAERLGNVLAENELSYVLYDGDAPVAEAQAVWRRQSFFDVVLETADGTFHAHIDLASPVRQSVAWKAGLEQSIAGFQLASPGGTSHAGWIETAGGRRLAWSPLHAGAYEFTVSDLDGARLITIAASSFAFSIGGDPGHTLIAPAEATDSELPALVVLAFALANEQVLGLDAPDPRSR